MVSAPPHRAPCPQEKRFWGRDCTKTQPCPKASTERAQVSCLSHSPITPAHVSASLVVTILFVKGERHPSLCSASRGALLLRPDHGMSAKLRGERGSAAVPEN